MAVMYYPILLWNCNVFAVTNTLKFLMFNALFMWTLLFRPAGYQFKIKNENKVLTFI